MFTVTEISNPFEPLSGLKKHTSDCGLSVTDWLRENKSPDWNEFDMPTICLLDGDPVMRADFCNTYPEQGQILSFVTIPEGIVSIVIAAVVAAAAVALVLSITPSVEGVGETPDADPVFTLKGQTNSNKRGQEIPSHYGEVRNWPDLAAAPYNQYEGNDQYQYLLLCLGHGEYDIEDIQIDNTPISSFQGITYEVYEPSETPTLFPSSVRTSSEVSGITLYAPNDPEYSGVSGPFVVNDAGTNATRIEVDYSFPRGLYSTNNKGDLVALSVELTFEYRVIDGSGDPIGSWTPFHNQTHTLATTTPQRFTAGVDLPSGRYEVRGFRDSNYVNSIRNNDELVWESARASIAYALDFGDVTLMAIKALATNNLNDQSRGRFNLRQKRKLKTWNKNTQLWEAATFTANPVWAFLDIMKASYGGRMSDEFLDLDYLADLAATFDSEGREFNWTFDQKINVWDAASLALSTARATPMVNGSKVTAIADREKTIPNAVFTPDNMIEGSFQWSASLHVVGSYDGLEIEYLDNESWKPETIECLVGSDAGTNPKKIKLNGITDRTLAYREGLYRRAKEVYQIENIEFETGLEGHIPNFNDLIAVSHDVMDWGYSGVVTSQSGQLVTLSDPFDPSEAGPYVIAFRRADGSSSELYAITQTSDPFVVELSDVSADSEQGARLSTQEPVFYQIGTSTRERKLARVVMVRPSGEDRVKVQCINNAPEIYTFDSSTPPAKPNSTVVPEFPAIADIGYVNVYATYSGNVFSQRLKILAKWLPVENISRYVVESSSDNVNWIREDITSEPKIELEGLTGQTYLRVAPLGASLGNWTVWSGDLGDGNDLLPTPTNLVVNSTEAMDRIDISADRAGSSFVRVKIMRQSDDTVLRTLHTQFPWIDFSESYTKAQYLADTAALTRERDFKIAASSVNSPSDIDDGLQIIELLTQQAPVAPSLLSAFVTDNGSDVDITVNWTGGGTNDFEKFRLWLNTSSGYVPVIGEEDYSGTNASATITGVAKTGSAYDMHFFVSAHDFWADDVVNYLTGSVEVPA